MGGSRDPVPRVLVLHFFSVELESCTDHWPDLSSLVPNPELLIPNVIFPRFVNSQLVASYQLEFLIIVLFCLKSYFWIINVECQETRFNNVFCVSFQRFSYFTALSRRLVLEAPTSLLMAFMYPSF